MRNYFDYCPIYGYIKRNYSHHLIQKMYLHEVWVPKVGFRPVTNEEQGALMNGDWDYFHNKGIQTLTFRINIGSRVITVDFALGELKMV